jgi:hypothetical protein
VLIVGFVLSFLHVVLFTYVAAFLPIRSRQKTSLLVIVSCLVATPVVLASEHGVAVLPVWAAYASGLDDLARTTRVAFRDTLWMVTAPGLVLTAVTAFAAGQRLRGRPFNRGPPGEITAEDGDPRA